MTTIIVFAKTVAFAKSSVAFENDENACGEPEQPQTSSGASTGIEISSTRYNIRYINNCTIYIYIYIYTLGS